MISSLSAYSILDFSGNLFLSKDGSVGASYILRNPEPYSLDEHKLDIRHEKFVQAFKNNENDIYVHKSDVVIEQQYDADNHYFNKSFISNAEARHFDKRDGIRHYCVITFITSGLKSLEKSYISNPLKYSSNLEKNDRQQLSTFFDKVQSATAILNFLSNTEVTALEEDELKWFFFNYVNGFQSDQGLRDIVFDSRMSIGENYYGVFSISDSTYLPEVITNILEDTSINRENVTLYRGFMDDFGVYLPFNHIYNQMLFFPGHRSLKNDLEQRIELYKRNQSFSSSLKHEYKRLLEIDKGILDNRTTLCYSHFNIITWDAEREKLRTKEDKIKGILDNKGMSYYIPSYEGLENIFVGSIVGRESKLHRDYWFLNTLENAACMFTNYSFYTDDPEGIVVQDRILQVPYLLDYWDRSKRRINARNFITFAPTGSGKSADTLQMCQQFLEDGINLVIAEFGSSFEQLVKLYPNRMKLVRVNQNTALGINPFDLEGSKLSKEKLQSLVGVVMRFWRLPAETSKDAKIRVTIRKTIQDYYEHHHTDHHFISYYNHIKENFTAIAKRKEFPEEYFDIQNFVVVCSEFLPGNIYHNVVQVNDEISSSLKSKDGIVFELKDIKSDPFLVSVVMTILLDTINEKILNDKTKRGYFIFDEMALGAELRDQYTGTDMLSTLSLIVATIRKDNGAVGLIYQTPTQMPLNNQYADSIVGNIQILNVLEGNEQVYDNIIKRFNIKNKEHINMMKSVQNDFSAARPYSEKFIRFNENYATVIRNEFSKEKFLAFQTEGPIWQALQDSYEETKDMETTIDQYIKQS